MNNGANTIDDLNLRFDVAHQAVVEKLQAASQVESVKANIKADQEKMEAIEAELVQLKAVLDEIEK